MKIEDYRASVPAQTNQILDLLISGTLHRKKLNFPLNFVVRIGDQHKIDPESTITDKIKPWLKNYCRKGCGPLISYSHCGFEDEVEAMLFKLAWG